MNEIKPVYLLAGGNFRNPESMVSLMAHAFKECTGHPRVAYIGVASGDNILFYNAIKPLIKKAGASEVFMLRLAKNKIDLVTVRKKLESADAIFISGGEVDDGMHWLKQNGLADLLKELYSCGKLFLGVSAGSIMMGTYWAHWEDPKDDSSAKLFDCLGIAPYIFDTHAEDEDWKELKTVLILKGPGTYGYGIPAGGMVIVDGKGQMVSGTEEIITYINMGDKIKKISPYN